MEIIKGLQEKLESINTYDDFLQILTTIHGYSQETVLLVTVVLGIRRTEDGSGMAGYMLAELQPDAPAAIDSLLSQIHAADLDASNRIVPFYLISQFGKCTVQQACKKFINTLPQGAPQSKVDAVLYWTGVPASELCKRFHDWEARNE